jgi:hypothetical protein
MDCLIYKSAAHESIIKSECGTRSLKVKNPWSKVSMCLKSSRATGRVKWLNGETTKTMGWELQPLQYPEDEDREGPRNVVFFRHLTIWRGL